MDKREFLSALERSLSVLQEDELKDIISEYEQHIDIKVEKGLTEEEAIADFGSFQELTAELLEAYHVRADYALGGRKGGWTEKIRGQRKKKAREEEEVSGAVMEGAEDSEGGDQAGAPSRERGLRQVFLRLPERWRRFKKGTAERKGEEESVGEAKDRSGEDGYGSLEAESPARFGRILRRREGRSMIRDSVGRGIRWVVRMIVCGVSEGFRLIWNGCWILFVLMAAGFGLMSLYGLGILAVLLAQGYPLAGVALGCLGLVMCTFSAAAFGMTLLKTRGRDAGKKRAMRERRAEAYSEPEDEEDEISRWEETDQDLQAEDEAQIEGGLREEETEHA